MTDVPSAIHTQLLRSGLSAGIWKDTLSARDSDSLLRPDRATTGRHTPAEPQAAARYFALLLEQNELDVVDALASLAVVEPAAALLLARRRTAADLLELGASAQALRAETRRNVPDADALTSHVRRFHELIVARAGSQTLAAQVGAVQRIVAAHTSVAVALACRNDWPTQSVAFSKAARSFDRLIGLLEQQAEDAAREHWARHMRVASRALMRWSTVDGRIATQAAGR